MPSEQAIYLQGKGSTFLVGSFRDFIKIPSEFTICQSELPGVGDILLRSAYKKSRCVLPSSKTVKIGNFMARLCRDGREMYKNVCCTCRVVSRIKPVAFNFLDALVARHRRCDIMNSLLRH